MAYGYGYAYGPMAYGLCFVVGRCCCCCDVALCYVGTSLLKSALCHRADVRCKVWLWPFDCVSCWVLDFLARCYAATLLLHCYSVDCREIAMQSVAKQLICL